MYLGRREKGGMGLARASAQLAEGAGSAGASTVVTADTGLGRMSKQSPIGCV